MHYIYISFLIVLPTQQVMGRRKDAPNPIADTKPYAGGAPHCFPQFGPGAIMQHGFARGIQICLIKICVHICLIVFLCAYVYEYMFACMHIYFRI